MNTTSLTAIEINLSVFALAIVCLASLAGILFRTPTRSLLYKLAIGGGMVGIGVGAILTFWPRYAAPSPIVRMGATAFMLVLVCASYFGKKKDEDERQRRSRTHAVWAMVMIVVAGIVGSAFLYSTYRIEDAEEATATSVLIANRTNKGVVRLQQEYDQRRSQDSIRHIADSLQIRRIDLQSRQNAALLIETQMTNRKLYLEFQKLRRDVLRQGRGNLFNDASPTDAPDTTLYTRNY